MKKIRLMQHVKNSHPEYSEKELFALILCGEVLVDGSCYKDPKTLVPGDSEVVLKKKKYVSRGGFKLEKALEVWKPKLEGELVLDAGCSTGGFTDCLLQHGADGVYAVDVGYNLLDFSLRNNPAVRVMEKTNIMSIEKLDPMPALAVADLSFRSIRSASSLILNLTKEKVLIALMKPQFEWEDPSDDFDGIIRDKNIIIEIAEKVIRELADEDAYVEKALISPVTGRKGNQELLFWISGYKERAEKVEVLLENLKKELQIS